MRSALATVLFISSTSLVLGHEAGVHQHIVRQAWQLLTEQYPAMANTELANHIGTNESGTGPWQTGCDDQISLAGAGE